MLNKLLSAFDENLKLTAQINAYSMIKIPLLAFITPRVVELTDTRSVVRVRLGQRSRNHLNAMYFGALAMGAELSIALKALQEIARSGKKIDFIFKDFKAEFVKRADGHVHFICEEAAEVAKLIHESSASSERFSRTFHGRAVLADNPEEILMTYALTLSVRNRSFGKK